MITLSERPWMRRGLGRTEVVVIVSVVVGVAVVGCLGSTFLAGLLLPALGKARQNARMLKDGTQIEELHASLVVWGSADFAGVFPTPGLIEVHGNAAVEDFTLNQSANFYSMLVMQNSRGRSFHDPMAPSPSWRNTAVSRSGSIAPYRR